MTIHLQGFIRRHGRKKAWVKQEYIYGKTKSNLRASVGLQSANNIQQGKAEQVHEQVSKHEKTGKARL